MMSDYSIEELESQICDLLIKRKQLLEEQGSEERYFVWNSKHQDIDYSAWVLSSRSVTDREVLESITNKDYYPYSWREYIKSWLSDQDMRNIDLSEVEDI